MSIKDDLPPEIDDSLIRSPTPKLPNTKKEIVDTYGVLDDKPFIATKKIEGSVWRLRDIRRTIETLTSIREELENEIATYMQDKAHLISADGEELVAWRFSKDSVKFNEKLFKVENKDIYAKYLESKPGNRTFLLKNKGE